MNINVHKIFPTLSFAEKYHEEILLRSSEPRKMFQYAYLDIFENKIN